MMTKIYQILVLICLSMASQAWGADGSLEVEIEKQEDEWEVGEEGAVTAVPPSLKGEFIAPGSGKLQPPPSPSMKTTDEGSGEVASKEEPEGHTPSQLNASVPAVSQATAGRTSGVLDANRNLQPASPSTNPTEKGAWASTKQFVDEHKLVLGITTAAIVLAIIVAVYKFKKSN